MAANDVQVPDTARVPVTVSTPKALRPGELRPLASWGLWACVGVVALTGFFGLLTLAAVRSRGRGLAALGISVLIAGAAGWGAIELARNKLNDTLSNTTGDSRGMVDGMVGQAERSLHDWLDITLAAGVGLVLLGVLVAGLRSLRKG